MDLLFLCLLFGGGNVLAEHQNALLGKENVVGREGSLGFPLRFGPFLLFLSSPFLFLIAGGVVDGNRWNGNGNGNSNSNGNSLCLGSVGFCTVLVLCGMMLIMGDDIGVVIRLDIIGVVIRLDIGLVRLDIGLVRLDIGLVRLDIGLVRLDIGLVRLDISVGIGLGKHLGEPKAWGFHEMVESVSIFQ